MKKLLFILLAVMPIILLAQDNPFTDVFPMINNEVTYTEVVQVDGTSNQELYKRSKIWIVDAFKSSKDVIQNDDKDNFILIGKGFFSGFGHNKAVANANYWFTIRIDSKDNRYKYTITDFIYDFDVLAVGSKAHFKENFSQWGNKSFAEYYQNLLDKKFPPNKERNSKDDEKYENLKEKFAKEQEERYIPMKEHYLLIDVQVKSIIDSLKKGMEQSDDNW